MQIFAAGSRFLPEPAPLWDLLPDVLTDVPSHTLLALCMLLLVVMPELHLAAALETPSKYLIHVRTPTP